MMLRKMHVQSKQQLQCLSFWTASKSASALFESGEPVNDSCPHVPPIPYLSCASSESVDVAAVSCVFLP